MVHVVYDVNAHGMFFAGQSGEGMSDLVKPYEGFRFQRGYGYRQYGRGFLGNILKKAWRYFVPLASKYALPLAKEAGKAIAEEGLTAGSNILSELNRGANLQETLAAQGTQAMKSLAKRAGQRLEQAGSGDGANATQEGAGPRKRKTSVNTLHLVGRSVLEKAGAKKARLKNNQGSF